MYWRVNCSFIEQIKAVSSHALVTHYIMMGGKYMSTIWSLLSCAHPRGCACTLHVCIERSYDELCRVKDTSLCFPSRNVCRTLPYHVTTYVKNPWQKPQPFLDIPTSGSDSTVFNRHGSGTDSVKMLRWHGQLLFAVHGSFWVPLKYVKAWLSAQNIDFRLGINIKWNLFETTLSGIRIQISKISFYH